MRANILSGIALRFCPARGMREKIVTRYEALAGSRNPMFQKFGEASEAVQYSGRIVEGAWECPYRRR
jgi:FPC/CPF motif-containing protein YcgG